MSRAIPLFSVSFCLVGMLALLSVSGSAYSQNISEADMQKAMKTQQEFFDKVFEQTTKKRDEYFKKDDEARARLRETQSSQPENFGNISSYGDANINIGSLSPVGGGSHAMGGASGKTVKMKYKHKKSDDPLDEVQLPQRVFNNIDRLR